MHGIENAVSRERDRREPQIEPEAEDRDADERAHRERLEDERARGAAHRREQHVVGGDDDRHYRVERSIPIEPDGGRQHPDAERENQAD